MSAFIAQLAHDITKWTSNSIDSLTTNNSGINDTEQKEGNEEQPKTDSQIISELLHNVNDEKLWYHLFNPKYREASKLFNKLAHKIDISYPNNSSLHPIDRKDESNFDLMNELRYSMRCAF